MAKEELTHKVYLATFGKPRYLMEIGKLIYGVKEKTYPKLSGEKGAIKKCLDKRWIKDITDSLPNPKEKPLGYEKRVYYQAKIDPIIESIEKRIETTLKITLNDKSEITQILYKILDSWAFRHWIEYNLPKNFKIISPVGSEFILSFLDILFILFDSNKKLKEQFKWITKIDDYENAIERLRKDKVFNEKLPDLTYMFYGEKNSSDTVKRDLPYLFVMPDLPLIKICGFSDFGNTYYFSKSLSQDVSKLFEG